MNWVMLLGGAERMGVRCTMPGPAVMLSPVNGHITHKYPVKMVQMSQSVPVITVKRSGLFCRSRSQAGYCFFPAGIFSCILRLMMAEERTRH
jgi:hypothetical protein